MYIFLFQNFDTPIDALVWVGDFHFTNWLALLSISNCPIQAWVN